MYFTSKYRNVFFLFYLSRQLIACPSAGIATCYGLDGPGVESQYGARFFTPVQTGFEAHPASYAMSTFSGVKRPGRDVYYTPLSSAEVNERVELYLYSPSGRSWPVIG
jgi:hypothetical protein